MKHDLSDSSIVNYLKCLILAKKTLLFNGYFCFENLQTVCKPFVNFQTLNHKKINLN